MTAQADATIALVGLSGPRLVNFQNLVKVHAHR
jgi:hypothetical protein